MQNRHSEFFIYVYFTLFLVRCADSITFLDFSSVHVLRTGVISQQPPVTSARKPSMKFIRPIIALNFALNLKIAHCVLSDS